MPVEIHCQRYPELKITVPDNPSQDDIAFAAISAEEVFSACIDRAPSEYCPPNCAISKIMAGNPRIVRAAIEQASNTAQIREDSDNSTKKLTG